MLDDSFRGKASRSPPGIRYDAIRTSGIAAILDLEKSSGVTTEGMERDV
jgi:hypothetical protein